MLLTFVYNMNFCLYRQPKSWHGGWLQLHRLQCMNWKLKIQIQSNNCRTPVTLLQLSPYTDCKARPEDARYKSSQKVPLAFVYNMNFLLVQTGNKLAWRLATAAWVAQHEPKIEDTNSTKKCWTPATPLQLSPYTGCKALPEDSRYKLRSEDAACFSLQYELLLVQAANKLAWRVTTTVVLAPMICEVKPLIQSSNLYFYMDPGKKSETDGVHYILSSGVIHIGQGLRMNPRSPCPKGRWAGQVMSS